MNKLHYIFIGILTLIAISISSCKDNYENYITDSDKVLSFSTDTLSFDTLLSTIGSPTQKFMIYNRHNRPLLISSIHLSKDKGFRINVDGEKGHDFSNIRIGENDSLYVFVETTLSESEINTPKLFRDEVFFITNNVTQKVVLEAYGQNVTILKSKFIEESMTLPNDKPYLIMDSLTVNENVTLNILPGTTFYLHAKAKFKVFGNIISKGTMEKPITFRGDRTDKILDIPYDRVPGQWYGIDFYANSFGNVFEYTHIRNGMYAMDFEFSNPEKEKIFISNSILTNVNGILIYAENCNINIENSELSNASSALLSLAGGKYSFNQCTFANYLPAWNGLSVTGQTVILSNYFINNVMGIEPIAIEAADFYNCIIYGNNTTKGQYIINTNKDYPDTPLNYKMQNCLLLKKDGVNDGINTIGCFFNEAPKFAKSTAGEDFIFDFRLTEESPARERADYEWARKLPFDMNGINRLGDDGPDIGAYEWIPTAEDKE